MSRILPARIAPALILAAAFAAALGGCASVHEAINGPEMSPMGYPAALVPQQQAILNPTPTPTPASPNSLWRVGARAFFNDQRARTVGDILTVQVTIDDSAQTSNTTSGSRSNSYSAATPTFFGLESSLGKILPSGYDPTKALGNTSSATDSGAGAIKRSEKISITMAAVVQGVLPNGNLIVQGTQEVRTDREVRVLTVSGIARPEDITATNTINSSQLAEARISYGGRGDMTNMQKPPASQALMEKFSPF
jgi:flagellar L-ring protein precursor FlgH